MLTGAFMQLVAWLVRPFGEVAARDGLLQVTALAAGIFAVVAVLATAYARAGRGCAPG